MVFNTGFTVYINHLNPVTCINTRAYIPACQIFQCSCHHQIVHVCVVGGSSCDNQRWRRPVDLSCCCHVQLSPPQVHMCVHLNTHTRMVFSSSGLLFTDFNTLRESPRLAVKFSILHNQGKAYLPRFHGYLLCIKKASLGRKGNC